VEEPCEWGTWTGGPEKSNLTSLLTRLKEGATNRQLVEEFPTLFIQYATRIAAVRLVMQLPRNPSTTPSVKVFWGKTGTGKTRKALWKMPDAYIKPNGKWWPLYEGQKNVIMDDFRAHPDFSFDELLRVLDRYPHIVETKGGHVQLQAVNFIITSNLEPDLWYKEADPAPLLRRITKTKHFRVPWEPPEAAP